MNKKVKTSFRITFICVFLISCMIAIFSVSYKSFLKMIYPLKYKEYVNVMSEKYGVDESLIYAIMKAESNFNPNAESKAGARGLMQIMPDTFDWLQMEKDGIHMDESYLYDPCTNIEYGVFFISILLNKYDNDNVAICAYNAGMGTVDKWLMDINLSDDRRTIYHIPYGETRIYQKEVLFNRKMYRELYF